MALCVTENYSNWRNCTIFVNDI